MNDVANSVTQLEISSMLRFVIFLHYPDQPADQDALPGMPSALEEAITSTSTALAADFEMFRRNAMSPSRFLASAALRAMTMLHRAFCGRKRNQPGGRQRIACKNEFKGGSDFVQLVSMRFCKSELDRLLEKVLGSTFAGDLNDLETLDALESKIYAILRPHRAQRQLRDILADRPNLQINAPVSRVGFDAYSVNREIARAIRDTDVGMIFDVEITSDYVSPGYEHVNSVEEWKVQSAIFRTSCMIVFGQGGGRGTGASVSLAEQLMIPTLLLWPEAENPAKRESFAARYPGTLANRQERYFSSPEEACEIARQFLREKEIEIFNRSHRLAALAATEITELTARFRAADRSLFDHSYLGYERARQFAEDPINFWQAPALTRDELSRLLGLPEYSTNRPATPVPRVAKRSGYGIDPRSIHTLFAFGRATGLEPQVLSEMLDRQQAELNHAPVSAREESLSYAVEDWEDLWRRMPGGTA